SIASLAGLASLAADVLVDVADALALVRLGLAPRTDVGGHLADELLVDAVDLDAGRLGHRELDAVRRVDHHRVREPEGQLDLVLALRGGPVADADDVELLAEPLGDARDHVGDQRADEPVHRAGAPGVVLALDEDLVAVLADRDLLRHLALQLSLGPLHGDGGAVDADLDTSGDGDGRLSDTRHQLPLTRRGRGPHHRRAGDVPRGRS